MQLNDYVMAEFDDEMQKTRRLLERVPEGKPDFRPHEKSMPLGRLAGHVAQLPELARFIVETPALDFANSNMKPLQMESRAQLLAAFDRITAEARQSLAKASDWERVWKLSFQGRTIVEQPRYLAYRGMFLNHLVHHRGQLGVYLRLNGVPLPPIYGPTADDAMGFA